MIGMNYPTTGGAGAVQGCGGDRGVVVGGMWCGWLGGLLVGCWLWVRK